MCLYMKDDKKITKITAESNIDLAYVSVVKI